MIQHDQTTVPFDPATPKANSRKFEFALPLRQRETGVRSKRPYGLVVSSDDEVRRELTEILVQCGLVPVLASTVNESGMALAGHEVFLVLCNDCLADGAYGDIVKMVDQSDVKVPVIVVSQTGDWPEYFIAIRAGVFDYLPYPPIPGELQRIIQNAFRECGCTTTSRELEAVA